MTLLGKLFRPWDIPGDDLSPTKESILNKHGSQSAKNISILNKPQNSVSSDDMCNSESSDKDKRSKSKIVSKMCQNKDTQNCDNSSSWSRSSSELSQSAASPSSLDPLFLHPTAISNLANLSRTELTAMGLLPPETPTLKVKRQRPKRFHCPHCQVAFSNNGQLRGHIRIHTGERPFTCEQEGCGKSFTRNEELTRHRRIHSGLRPFPCTYCGKKFGRKDHLKKHTRTHQRPMFNGGMIGFGNPFHPFHPSLMSNEFNPAQPSYGLPFVLGMPPPSPHFHFP